MAEKILNTRILMKVDTLENWNNSTLPLKKGELAFATVAATAGTGLTEPVVMVKIGEDGVKTFKDLDWNFYAKSSDVIAQAKSAETLEAFVNNVIAKAGIASSSAMEALAGRVTTVENDLNTEATGLKARMTTAEGAIDAVEALVGDKKVATQISEALAALNLDTTYAAKALETTVANHIADTVAHVTSDDKTKWNAALQVADIAAGTANGTIKVRGTDIAVTGLGSAAYTASTAYDAAGSAAAAETAAKSHADGLNTAMNTRVEALEAIDHSHTFVESELNLIKAGDVAKWNAAEQNAKDYADGRLTALIGDKSVSEQIEALDLANTYAAKSHKHVKADITDFAHTHEISEVNGLQGALDGKQAVGDYATKAEAQGYANAKDEAIAAAQSAADQAQEEVDALETYVGTIPEGYTETNVVAYINKKAQETLDAASGGSSESAASVLAALNTYKAENDPKVQANTEAIAGLEELVGDTKVSTAIETAVAAEKTRAEGVEGGLETRLAAVEGDYLKAADKTELEGKITTNANAIERLTNGVSAEEVDGVNDLIQYVKDHGTEVTGMKNDIKANSEAIEAIEADYLKAADKTELSGLITGLDTRMGAAETAIGTKAAQADLEALADRVTTVEGELNTETTGLKARMTQAEADINALETKVGDETVAAQIEAAIEALKIGDYAKAADLTAAVARIAQNETDITTLEGRMDTAESDIDTLESEVAKKANDADLAAIAKTGNVNDLAQTAGDVLIFDCGNASV